LLSFRIDKDYLLTYLGYLLIGYPNFVTQATCIIKWVNKNKRHGFHRSFFAALN